MDGSGETPLVCSYVHGRSMSQGAFDQSVLVEVISLQSEVTAKLVCCVVWRVSD